MVEAGVPAEEVGELHQTALVRLSQTAPELKLPEIVEAISTPLMELLISYGLVQRQRLISLGSANEALAVNEKRFKDFADSASDWMWETDSEHRFTFISDTFTGSTGVPVEEWIGNKVRELTSWNADDNNRRNHREDLENRRPFREFVYEVRDREGMQLYFRDSGMPLLDADGAFQGYRGTGSNITAQIKAERRAEQTRLRLAQSLSSITEGFSIFDKLGNLVICNDKYRAAYPLISDILVPGVSSKDILRTAAQRGKIEEAEDRLDEWIEEKLARPLEVEGIECLLSDRKWYRISEQCTKDGDVVKVLTDITEMKQRETALAEQSALLEMTFDNMDQGICLVDAQMHMVAFNKRYLEFYDLDEGGLKPGTNIRDFYRFNVDRGWFAEDALHSIEHAMKPENLTKYVRDQISWRDGILVEMRRNPTPEGGFVTTLTDITEQKLVEQAIQQSEAHLKSVMENVAEGIVMADEHGIITSFNLKAENDFGYSSEEIIGQSLDILVPEEVGVNHEESIQSFLKTNETEVIGAGFREVLGRRKNGTAFPAEISVSDIKTPGSRSYVGIVRDITDRKAAEDALRSSEGRLARAQEIAKVGDWEFDVEKGQAQISDAFGRILGLDPEQTSLTAEEFAAFVHPEERQSVMDNLYRSIEENIPFELDFRITRNKDDIRSIFARGAPICDENERVVGVVGIGQDITDQKLMESQLIQAQKMDIVGQLTGGIAHDFNNILTIIQGNGELLERRIQNDEKLSNLVNSINSATRRGSDLTHRLLAFSRSQNLDITVINVNELIAGMGDLLRRTLSENISVRIIAEDELWPIEADYSQLENAILNLAVNARDAMTAGGALTISTENVTISKKGGTRDFGPAPGNYAVIGVADTGCGMDDKILKHVFEPFFTTKEVGKGTGLGLSMVFGFIQQSKGHIEIESEVNLGTKFNLYFPVAEPMAVVDEIKKLDSGDVPSGNETILLVEDDAEVRRTGAQILHDLGYQIIEAENGPTALDILEANAGIDLVFTDIVMPGGVTGIELGQKVREKYPELKLLFTSGYADEVLEKHKLTHSELNLIRKPYRADELARQVRRTLEEI